MKSKSRSREHLKRRRAFLNARDLILIACEGEATEVNYFKHVRKELGLSSVEIKVAGREFGSAPINVVDYAISQVSSRKPKSEESRDKARYNEAWCIMDVEIPPHPTLKAAIAKAKTHKLQVCLSNPCFEYWFILHYEKTSFYFSNNAQVISRLKRYIPDYVKGAQGHLPEVFRNSATAKANAEQVIFEKNYGEDITDCIPSTHVQRLLVRLEGVAQKASKT